MKHTISVLVENRPGVLARIAGLFSGRGYNIDSLSVGETQDPSVSRMTIVSHGDDPVLEQIVKQLNKLINIIKVQDFAKGDFVDRELLLLKVNCTSATRLEIMEIVNIFRAKVVDISRTTLTVEITGAENKIQAFIDLMKPFGLKETVRTGKIAIARGK